MAKRANYGDVYGKTALPKLKKKGSKRKKKSKKK